MRPRWSHCFVLRFGFHGEYHLIFSTIGDAMRSAALLLLFLIATQAHAQNSPYLVSPNGQYLGNLNSNRYDPNSVSNPYGQYGSQYSPNSINNPYGQYGSPYSPSSPNNPYATQAPMIMSPPSANPYGSRR
jgi:hypothetical protein